MSLDPTASAWPGVVASVAICLWMAAIGVPLAHAVFRHRPRLVWPFYAPIVGVAVVLLVTNLAAYIVPGAPAAWVGLLIPSALGAIVAWRGGAPRPLRRGSKVALLAMALTSVGVFALAYATRLHTANVDAAWHQALAFQLARGVFPPVTPYGVDASPVYHYGHNLLAASVMNAAGVFPWTAFDALRSFLVAVLVLAVVGFAYDVGAPLPLALGLGAVVGFFRQQLLLGIDAGLLEPSSPGHAFQWLDQSQWALALGFVVLVAAALHGGTGRRQAAVLAASAGVFALAEAAVMIFACAALALVGSARLLRLRGRERIVLAAALLVSAGLVVLAGGPISDVLLGRGGSTAGAYLAWEPVGRELQPVQPAGPWLVSVGIIALTVIGAFAAYRRRSWGLSFIVAAGVAGLLEAQLLQAQNEIHEVRIFGLALVVATIGALAGLGALVGALRGSGRRLLALALLGLLVLLPTSLPHAVSGVQLALKDLKTDASGHQYRYRAYFGAEVAANWEYYDWLRRSLPKDAHLLSRARAPQCNGDGNRVAQVRPRPASVFALGCHVGLRRRPALPAPRRPVRHGHHSSSRHRPTGGRDGAVRASPARRPGPFHAARGHPHLLRHATSHLRGYARCRHDRGCAVQLSRPARHRSIQCPRCRVGIADLYRAQVRSQRVRRSCCSRSLISDRFRPRVAGSPRRGPDRSAGERRCRPTRASGTDLARYGTHGGYLDRSWVARLRPRGSLVTRVAYWARPRGPARTVAVHLRVGGGRPG